VELDIRFNQLASLPDFLGHLPRIEKIWCKGNPLPALPSYHTKLDLEEPQSPEWWDPKTDNEWTTKGQKSTSFETLLIKESSSVLDQAIFTKFIHLAAQLGFDPATISKVYAVSNKGLVANFNNHRATFGSKHAEAPSLFRKDDWRDLEDKEQRQGYLDWHAAFAAQFGWNSEDNLPRVIPMLQGTSEVGAWAVCENGFGRTSSVDPGYYGAGMYSPPSSIMPTSMPPIPQTVGSF